MLPDIRKYISGRKELSQDRCFILTLLIDHRQITFLTPRVHPCCDPS